METIEEIFSAIAEAFRRGHLETAAAAIATPAPIYMADRTLVLANSEQVIGCLGRLRDGLLADGYFRSVFEILQKGDAGDHGMRALIRWTNLTGRYGVIGSLDVNYFFARDEEGRWRISLIEVLSPTSSRLAAALGGR